MPELTSTPPNDPAPTVTDGNEPAVVQPAPAPVLGVDPPEPAPVAPAPTPAPVESKKIELTEEQHAELLQKGQAFDAIQGDPQLAGLVGDHFRRLASGQNPAEPQTPTPASAEDDTGLESFPEFKELKEQNAETQKLLRQTVAELAAERLLRTHPDANTYEKEIVKLVNDNGHNLEDAYQIAKARAVNATPSSSPVVAPAPTTEAKGPGIPQGIESDVLQTAADKIDDPTRRVRIGEALDIAWDAANKHHESQ